MKMLLALALASSCTLGLVSTAQAAFAPKDFYAHQSSYEQQAKDADHDRNGCVGLSSGSAHFSCGTETGGPVGGLH